MRTYNKNAHITAALQAGDPDSEKARRWDRKVAHTSGINKKEKDFSKHTFTDEGKERPKVDQRWSGKQDPYVSLILEEIRMPPST